MLTYTIVQGDTLQNIAKTFYNDPMKYKEIASANHIDNPSLIHIGQELILPHIKNAEVSRGDASKSALISASHLQSIMPMAIKSNIEKYLTPLNQTMHQYKINTPLRIAHFIAQLAHESACFRVTTENLNYSVTALQSVFPSYFPTQEIALQYARKPEQIANRVYANRMLNGDENSGDGWKYRGRGLIQLSGKENYINCDKALQLNLLDSPEQLASVPSAACDSAGWFWEEKKLNQYADEDNIKAITRKINGGDNGLSERKKFLAGAKLTLNI